MSHSSDSEFTTPVTSELPASDSSAFGPLNSSIVTFDATATDTTLMTGTAIMILGAFSKPGSFDKGLSNANRPALPV